MREINIEKPVEFMELAKKKSKEFLYYDHPSDGIDFFTDEQLEDIGWNACAFPFLDYRKIATFIEENCEGTLTFSQTEMGFNGFVEVDNIEAVRVAVKNHIIEQIKSNPLSEYDEDQMEALEFFEIN